MPTSGRRRKGSCQAGKEESGVTSPALPEPTLDKGELEEALAYIRQKKEGILPCRKGRVLPDIDGPVGVHYRLSTELQEALAYIRKKKE